MVVCKKKKTFQISIDLSVLIGDIVLIQRAKNLLFPTMCCNVNLVKPFGDYALASSGSTAKNLHARRDHNLICMESKL